MGGKAVTLIFAFEGEHIFFSRRMYVVMTSFGTWDYGKVEVVIKFR